MNVGADIRAQAQALLEYIDASPSPWHAVAEAGARLEAAGFARLEESERWRLEAGGKYYTVRGGSSLIAFAMGDGMPERSGFRIVGAHTDSPGLRLKPRAPHAAEGMARLGVEVYGGPILATFADRDLGLAGRVMLRTPDGPQARLLRTARPMARLPNLAIHMNRSVNEEGLKFNKQTELPLLLGYLSESLGPIPRFLELLAREAGVDADDILNWELLAFDTQKGAFWGADEEFIADSQLDNLVSCHAALRALTAAADARAICVCALFDHEEVGSESFKGAAGGFLTQTLERVAVASDREGWAQAAARSFFVSADMAHAYHPNFPGFYEPAHHVRVNGGPVVKTHVCQRYATDGETEAQFMRWCEEAGVPFQQYAHRTDLGCGSTIGPIVAARLGMRAVDVGNPMWAMHSLRESAGVLDHAWTIRALERFYSAP